MLNISPELKNSLFNHVMAIIVFFGIYYWLYTSDNNHFSAAKKPLDIWYFTTTTHSTSGYGDITPTSDTAKIFVSMHHCVIIALAIQLLFVLFYVTPTSNSVIG